MTGSEHTAQLHGQPVFWRTAPGDPARPPVLYVHGVPTSSDLWPTFLERTGGVAPDLPGFGRSTKRGDLDASIGGYAAFLDAFCELAGLDRVRLVVHDWGGAALAWAAARPERIDRVVVIDAVPLLPGYRWHRLARAWRTPLLGEVVMGLTLRPVARRLSRGARGALAQGAPMPEAFLDDVLRHFDVGTQRAILRLYRGADPDVLAAAGERLGELRCPALVAWGEDDPYVPARFAGAYAEALGGPAETILLQGAGHWPWVDRPELVEQVSDFLAR